MAVILLELLNTANQPVNPGEYDILNGVHSSIIVEVIKTNFRLLCFFLRENFTSIKSIKTETSEQKR